MPVTRQEEIEMLKLLGRLTLVAGAAGVVTLLLEWRRARAAGEVPFPAVRSWGNERLNPWLLKRGLVGGEHSELAILEHVGRTSGTTYFTPVHVNLIGNQAWIMLAFGDRTQWARNVVAAGRCHIQLHETLHELDEPVVLDASESPHLSAPVAALLERLGTRYLRFRLGASVPGTFATHGTAIPHLAGEPAVEEPPLDAPFELPVHLLPGDALEQAREPAHA